MTDDILLLEDLLNLKLPQSYIRAVAGQKKKGAQDQGILGLPLTPDIDSAWGATEYLRNTRPDLPERYLVISFIGDVALCLETNHENFADAPVVGIHTENKDLSPGILTDSFERYLQNPNSVETEIGKILGGHKSMADQWFRHGLQRLDRHMQNISFQYDHKEGGQLPRSHVWRPYRFCVQDVVLGLTVIRHDRKYNRLEVDVFLTAEIPEYEYDSGCRALALILLSDAYKSGGSMEIRFTKHVEGGKVPDELCQMADRLGIRLSHARQGGISPAEAKRLYLALSDFSKKVADKVMSLEDEGRLSAASVCYAMHHGVWTAPEIDIILHGSRFPESILTGSLPAEVWHLFQHDLLIGRNALTGAYLDRQLSRREHSIEEQKQSESQTIVELEDDERSLQIDFEPKHWAKIYRLGPDEKPIAIPWLHNPSRPLMMLPDQPLWVLLRTRDAYDLEFTFEKDITEAVELRQKENVQVCILVPGDFRRLATHFEHLRQQINDNNIGIIVCPEFIDQLDGEMQKRFESVKVMRQ